MPRSKKRRRNSSRRPLIAGAMFISPRNKNRESSSHRRKKQTSERGKLAVETETQITTCSEEVTLIADYLSSSLAPSVSASFEKHLSACPDCAAFLQTYKRTIEVTRAFLKNERLKSGPRKLVFRTPSDNSHS